MALDTFYGDDDIDLMLADFGIDVKFGADTLRALPDSPDELLLQDGGAAIIGRVSVLTFKTTDIPALEIDSRVFIGTTEYEVRGRLRADDGALTLVELEVVK